MYTVLNNGNRTNVLHIDQYIVYNMYILSKNILEPAGPLVYSADEQLWEYINIFIHTALDLCTSSLIALDKALTVKHAQSDSS